MFDPPIEGEKWDLGAVSTAEWTGVPLLEVLERAGVRKDAREALFRGADGGAVEGRPEPIRFERSLRIDDANISDALLAYAMNGEPLPIRHGYPVPIQNLNPNILMMEPAEDWNRGDAADLLRRAKIRSILIQ